VYVFVCVYVCVSVSVSVCVNVCVCVCVFVLLEPMGVGDACSPLHKSMYVPTSSHVFAPFLLIFLSSLCT